MIKNVFISIVALIAIASCASKKPAETTATPAAAPTVTQTAAATVEKTATTAKEKVKAHVAKTKAEATSAASKLTCTAGKEIRTLEIKSGEGKACELMYTKGGETKSLATATADAAYCKTVSEKVSKNLQAAGYKCE